MMRSPCRRLMTRSINLQRVPCQPVSVRSFSRFFEFALALSAWKKGGEMEWALRSNPSSGNLHPTEGYLVLPQIDGLDLSPGLYHYASKEHGLEFRAEFSAEQVALLLAPFPPGAFLFGLTSVHWREAWKYGERAFRYCNHDVGHAIGSARVAAATLGWNMALLDGVEQNTVAMLLGTDRTGDFGEVEPEHPDCLAVIWPLSDVRGEGLGVWGGKAEMPLYLDAALVKDLSNASWHGKANQLSHDHGVHWDIIDEAAAASWKTLAEKRTILLGPSLKNMTPHPLPPTPHRPLAGQIIRQRRSAVSFDGTTSISAATFFQMMQMVMPCPDRPQLDRPMPWDGWPYTSRAIDLVLFVHRRGWLTPGLYFLVRDPQRLSCIQQSMNPELTWTPAPGCPRGMCLSTGCLKAMRRKPQCK